MRLMPAESVDVVFADPPYRLSSGGVSVRSGRLVPVDKGGWDRPMGLEKDHEFNVRWLRATRRVLKPEGTLWVSGTHHIIFSIGFALQRLGFKIINRRSHINDIKFRNDISTKISVIRGNLRKKGRDRTWFEGNGS